MSYAGFGRKNKRALIRPKARIDTLFPYIFAFLQKVVYKTTMLGAGHLREVYDFFDLIPPPVPGL